MRTTLARDDGNRKRFSAIFVRLGKKINFKGYSEDTILLKQVKDLASNQLVTDHLWFAYTKGFENIQLTEGALLEFEARVKQYKKGYVNKAYKVNRRTTDYKLSHPTKIKRIEPPG